MNAGQHRQPVSHRLQVYDAEPLVRQHRQQVRGAISLRQLPVRHSSAQADVALQPSRADLPAHRSLVRTVDLFITDNVQHPVSPRQTGQRSDQMMQPLARDQIADKKDAQRTSIALSGANQLFHRALLRRRQMVPGRVRDHAAQRSGVFSLSSLLFTLSSKSSHRLPGRPAVENKAVHRTQIGSLHRAVQRQQPARMLLAAAQVVHDADQRIARLKPSQPPVHQRQRRMVQLVLQQNIHGEVAQTPVQAQREVVGQMRRIAAPGERHNLDRIAGLA